MAAFAANSLLARAALGAAAIDAASFTAIRLCSGAALLGLLLVVRRRRRLPGNFVSAAALFVYAIGFSLAYLRLGAATGALILFASVQASMIGWGILRRDHPTRIELAGLAVAFIAFVALLLPGLAAPDPLGSLLMICAGVAWGVYSLRGAGADTPLDATAGNFIRAAPLCLLLIFLPDAATNVTEPGIAAALLSGLVASALGYAIWYQALPRLRRVQAATVQLTVPLIAALGAVLFLSEALTTRLVVSGSCILGGVAIAILARRAR